MSREIAISSNFSSISSHSNSKSTSLTQESSWSEKKRPKSMDSVVSSSVKARNR